MDVCLITGAAGLVGAESVRGFAADGFDVVGVDNDQRARLFGAEASTRGMSIRMQAEISRYRHCDADIRDPVRMEEIFIRYGSSIGLVIHTAAQPSHDWAARDPMLDFSINANATLLLLELTRKHCPEAVFVLMSTNKVYGDRPNQLPLVELETRYELAASHPFFEHGIDESLSVDQSLHSLFGVSKLAADVMVQEYARYFGLKTACFRAGCISGAAHAGTELHGFLSYLMRCAAEGKPYAVYGHGGKQVRDNIHARDLVSMFRHFHREPRAGEVYNVGGGRFSNASLLEASRICERIVGREMDLRFVDEPRRGDHVWWISDVRKFASHYPAWAPRYDVSAICEDIYSGLRPGGSRTSQSRRVGHSHAAL